MKYLCLGYYDADRFDGLSPAEQQALGDECRPHDEALRASGRLVAVASLEHRTSAVLRPGKGRTSIIDGPFTESKELVGSFFIIEAGDLDDAIRVASLHPAANVREDLGFAIEVRPIETYVEADRTQPPG